MLIGSRVRNLPEFQCNCNFWDRRDFSGRSCAQSDIFFRQFAPRITFVLSPWTCRLAQPSLAARSGSAKEDKQQQSRQRAYRSAICPLDLSSHEATRQNVDPLQNPDNSHANQQHRQNPKEISHTLPFWFMADHSRAGRGADSKRHISNLSQVFLSLTSPLRIFR